MADPKPNESKPSDGAATSEFVGFANAPVNEDGSHVDFRDVPAYDAERDEAIKEPSSIAQFSTADQSTDGSPMAVVPDPDGFDQGDLDDTDEYDFADDFEDELEDEPEVDPTPAPEPNAPAVTEQSGEVVDGTVIDESKAETSEVGDPQNPADPTSQPQV